MTNFG